MSSRLDPLRDLPERWLIRLWVAVAAVGLISGFSLKGQVAADAHALGSHTISLLGPLVGATAFLFGVCLLDRLSRRMVLATGGLFFVLCLPFADLLSSPIVHLEGDDSFRYSTYAHHILTERTLWGADGLLHDVDYYVDQPGYRYYLAATIALLGGEHRGLQLFDMGVMLLGMVAVLGAVGTRGDRPASLGLAAFLLGAAPYAAKNILYGYTEWFTVLLALFATRHVLTRRWLAAIVLLAVIPFVRQNLLLVSLLLAGTVLVTTRRYWLGLPYLALLGLPLYHNAYYADRWQLLVTNRGAEVELGGGVVANLGEVALEAVSKVPHYLGYHPDQDLGTIAIAVMFVPLGTGLAAWLWSRLDGPARWVLAGVAIGAIGPTLVLGHGSYPRFVYVNLSVIVLAYWMLRALFAEHERFDATGLRTLFPRPPGA